MSYSIQELVFHDLKVLKEWTAINICIQNVFFFNLFLNQAIAGSQERQEQAACDKLSISEGERAQTSAGVQILCQ